MLVLSIFIHLLLVLLSVAFFTLFERKVIGLFHNRVGPNKVSFIGLVQPLLDAFKLMSKQKVTPLRSNKLAYNFSPHLALFLSLFLWLSFPSVFFLISLNISFLMFLCVSSFIVFSVLLAGWSSNSKYSLIGRLRSVAQSISYESVLRTLCVLVVIYLISFSIRSFLFINSFLLFTIFPIWFICSLAETHRAPFDFSEAESELVSGFNTEYSGMYFAFIFLSEYGALLYSCLLISFIFFYFFCGTVFTFIFVSLFIRFIFIWVRITFCRYRYDMLMMFSWKVLLPFSLIILVFFLSLLVF